LIWDGDFVSFSFGNWMLAVSQVEGFTLTSVAPGLLVTFKMQAGWDIRACWSPSSQLLKFSGLLVLDPSLRTSLGEGLGKVTGQLREPAKCCKVLFQNTVPKSFRRTGTPFLYWHFLICRCCHDMFETFIQV
jgi:hypothetical protein